MHINRILDGARSTGQPGRGRTGTTRWGRSDPEFETNITVPSAKHLVSVYYIFQNLVQRMPHVWRAVCKRWPVVHDELGRSCSFGRSSTTHFTRSTLPFVHILEAGGNLGLALGCICTHGEFGLWQQQRLIIRTLQRCKVAHTKGENVKRKKRRKEEGGGRGARKC